MPNPRPLRPPSPLSQRPLRPFRFPWPEWPPAAVPAVPVPVASTVRRVPGVNPDDAEASGLTMDALGYVYEEIDRGPGPAGGGGQAHG